MSSATCTTPDLFIIESLSEGNFAEGKVMADILNATGKRWCEYLNIRTKIELEWAVDRFAKSDHRYLHLSCHGSETSMSTTLQTLSFAELGAILKPVLNERRLFISACSMVNSKLAEMILPESGCFSMIGPTKKIGFGDAALIWASFYHLMSKRNQKAMKRHDILDVVQTLSSTFRVPMDYYTGTRRDDGSFLYRRVRAKAQTEQGSDEREVEQRRGVVHSSGRR